MLWESFYTYTFQDAVAGRVNIRWTSYAITVRGLLVDITEWWPAYPYEFIMPIDNKILKTIAWGQPYSFSMCHNIYGVTCLWCTGTGLVIMSLISNKLKSIQYKKHIRFFLETFSNTFQQISKKVTKYAQCTFYNEHTFADIWLFRKCPE